MVSRPRITGVYLIAAAIALLTMLSGGCGGKGGRGDSPSASLPGATGYGKIAAVVKLKPPAGRAAEAVGSSTVTVTISITGVYGAGAEKKEFRPVSTTSVIDFTAGPAKVSLLKVPVGANHLLTVVADWGGATDTLKTIIPEVKESETSNAVANEATTAAADAALFLAARNGKKLYQMSPEEIAKIYEAVERMAAGGMLYSQMTPAGVVDFMGKMNVVSGIAIMPATATVAVGGQMQFMAMAMDANGMPVPATASWAYSSTSSGSISASGLFNGTASGAGVVTASYLSFTATAAVTVVSVCGNNAACNDNNPLTLDTCLNPGLIIAQCSYATIACAADADCNDNNPQTVDSCVGGGTAGASCLHAPIANQPPAASATASVPGGIAPLTVNFSGSCQDLDGTCVLYEWNFGDGSATATAQNPAHIYVASGTYAATLAVTDDQGAKALSSVFVIVAGNQAPVGSAVADAASGTAPLNVNFTGGCSDADGTCVSYMWNFGDGSPTNSSQSPSHSYAVAGTYTATLTVTDNLGAATQQTVTITVAANQPPAATSVSATPAGGVAPLLVNFTANCFDPDGTCAGYLWEFGDGATSALQTPGHTYNATGAYNAVVTVTDNLGAIATGAVTVNVAANQPPVAAAGSNVVNGIAPLAVNFTGGCTDPDGTCVSYQWNFGDGSATDTTQNPSHTYTATGAFNAVLTVTDNLGLTSQSVRNISVGANQLPVGSISLSPASGTAPLPVNFTGGCSDADGTCVSYLWNFGDGSPTVSTQNPSHTYAGGGAFTVTLTVTDNMGAVTSSTTIVNVNNKPVAGASANIASGIAPLAVNFTGTCTDSDGTCAGYLWEFGDGATSSLQTPSHTYNTAGSFVALLTVKDNLNAIATSAVNVAVSANQPPVAAAGSNVVNGIAPLAVNFTGGCTDPDGTCVSYSWNFGDGSATDTTQNPSHTYTATGTFNAILTVTDNLGLSAQSVRNISVGPNQLPVGSISAGPASGTAPLPVNFTGTCTDADGTCVSYLWNFGDGSPTVSTQNPSHTYAGGGAFTVTLSVTDDLGAVTSSTFIVNVNNKPTAGASVNIPSGIAPLAVNFTGTCTDTDGTCASYMWEFGDGATSSLQSPSHTYSATGAFVALLTVKDNLNAIATSSVNVTVVANQPPVASATSNFISGVAPLNVNFTGACTDPDGTCVSYSWNFGDGSATNTTQNPSHTYSATGTFNATLTVTDNLGLSAQTVRTITVVANQLPTGSISASPATGTAPLPVNFTGTCADADGTCVSYSWNFGDGSPTASTQNASHTYAVGGAYTVTLTVTDNLGAVTNSTFILNVNNKPVAGASVNIPSGIAPLAVNFTGTCTDSDGTCASYMWEFGDGATSSLQNPSHTYNATGTLVALLTVKDNLNAIATSSVTVTVAANQPPVASATSNFISGVAPLNVNFTGSCADPDGTCVSYSWNFGDGSATNTTQNPSHTYTATGTFNATLTVTDNLGLSAQTVRTITVVANQLPVGSISAGPAVGMAPLSVNFNGTCADADGTCVSYLWNFGDGSPTVTTQNASHTYVTGGVFIASFTVTDNMGATMQSTASITVVVPAACGNGALEIGEFCDDGNTASGDGCTAECYTEIQGGYTHACAMNLSYAGGVQCWGDDWIGILGDGVTAVNSSPPVGVLGLTAGVKQFSVSASSSCAVTTGGGVKCWGDNTYGQTGNGATTTTIISPLDVTGLTSGVSHVSQGGNHACAVTTGGGVKCWGLNNYGQLGNGNTTNQLTPVDVTGLASGVKQVATGNSHTCALTSLGGVKCWGRNHAGQVGDGAVGTNRNTPVDVAGLTSGVVFISLGDMGDHTCAVTMTGGVKCWGDNGSGQVGDGTNNSAPTPVAVTGLTSGVTALDLGTWHSCALTSAGGMKCWGQNPNGQLGNGTSVNSLTPVDVSTLTTGVGSVGLGQEFSCARKTNGQLYCWGKNTGAQLGDGTATTRLTPTLVRLPPTATSGSNIVSGIAPLAVNFTGTCADPDGTCASYSWNFGDGSAVNTTQNPSHTYTATGTFNATLTVTDNQGLTAKSVRVITVAANQLPTSSISTNTAAGTAPLAVNFTGGCVDADGTCVSYLWNFGDGSPTASTQNASHTYSAAGVFIATFTVTDNNGGATISTATISVSGVCGNGTLEAGETCDDGGNVNGDGCSAGCFMEVQAAQTHNCVMNYNYSGGVECWGANANGQLGSGGATATSMIPVPVSGLTSGVKQISGGYFHTCAVTNAGGVKCWGRNTSGQLGDGTGTERNTPVDVSGLTSGVAWVDVGNESTCAVTTAGGVKCWGDNSAGQLGDGTTAGASTPHDVIGLTSGVASVEIGSLSACALTNAGGVKCWGRNNEGQVGDGTTTNRLTPVDVAGLTSGVAAITQVNGNHVCAILTSGGLKCWGNGSFGKLGNNTTTNAQTTPVNVTGLSSGVKGVNANSFGGCALMATGGVKCWGYNSSGSVGDGTTTDRLTPVDVTGLTSGFVSPPSGGVYHTCARKSNGVIYCWGAGGNGALGDGTNTNSSTPVIVNVKPAGSISTNVASGTAPLPVNFTGGCTDADGSCVSYLWDFGDGAPTASTQNASHTYNTPGNYVATFTVTDNNGASTFSTVSISVAPNIVCGNNIPEPGEECDDGNAAKGDGCSQHCLSEIAVSMEHVCAINRGYDEGLECWGRNFHGQQGDGTTTNRPVPTAVPGLTSGVKQVVAGNFFVCALTTAGGVKCWGYNANGMLGIGNLTSQLTPMDVTGLASGVKMISAGTGHVCAVMNTGGLKCWGLNNYGQVGNGGGADVTTPVDVPGLTNVAYAALGDNFTCVLSTAGGVKCWGRGNIGSLGAGDWNGSTTPVNVLGLTSGVAMISTGSVSSQAICALTTAGGIKCWGENLSGGLGDGTTVDKNAPVDVIGLTSGMKSLGVGFLQSCALTTAGAAKCWGNNAYGTLGDGTNTHNSLPVNVAFASGTFGIIRASRTLTGARATSGEIYLWGDNSYGQYGNGSTVGPSNVPVTFSVSKFSSNGTTTCVVTGAGGLKCWGYNGTGQLGDGTVTNRTTPAFVSGLSSGVLDVSVGTANHACALTTAGGIVCWGQNVYGELGNGTTTDSTIPVNVTGLGSGVLAFESGFEHNCAITTAGGLKCWGMNAYNEIGDGSGTTRTTPVDVPGFTTGVSRASGRAWHNCMVTTAGGVKCWGEGYPATPTDVSGLTTGVLDVKSGYNSDCALMATGGVKCWGNNGSGQLGDGTNTNSIGVPVDVAGLSSGVVAITMTWRQACALLNTGGVKCWGENTNGQLGNGTTTNSNVPVDVTGLSSGVKSIYTSGSSPGAVTCASQGGALKCWGHNGYGQLGDGTTTQRLTPVNVLGF